VQQSVNYQYLPLVRAQYPSLFDSLTEPAVITMSSRLDDLDLAIESLKHSYAEQGCEDIDSELERVGHVLDDLQGRGGSMPLPGGVLLLTLLHGEPSQRERLCVPVRRPEDVPAAPVDPIALELERLRAFARLVKRGVESGSIRSQPIINTDDPHAASLVMKSLAQVADEALHGSR
jgi:hypothetical protein